MFFGDCYGGYVCIFGVIFVILIDGIIGKICDVGGYCLVGFNSIILCLLGFYNLI